MYEVELKFPVADPAPIVGSLSACGAVPEPPVEQSDVYFNHPTRDFEATDEALRIRSVAGRHTLTYKGPVVDSQTKTRRELEVSLGAGDSAKALSEVLTVLGFRSVRTVRKRRHSWRLAWQNRQFEIAVDDVEGLGTFVEVETLADEGARAAAVEAILSLVSRFRLPASERQSYLALLLEKDRQK